MVFLQLKSLGVLFSNKSEICQNCSNSGSEKFSTQISTVLIMNNYYHLSWQEKKKYWSHEFIVRQMCCKNLSFTRKNIPNLILFRNDNLTFEQTHNNYMYCNNLQTQCINCKNNKFCFSSLFSMLYIFRILLTHC